MAIQIASNKCQCGSAMGVATHRLARHLFAAALLASVLSLVASAPTVSESDGSQTGGLSAGTTLGSHTSTSSLTTPMGGAAHPTLSHLVKRSAPAPYSGHSIMRFGRAAHSIMHFGKRSTEQLDENVANEPLSDAQRQSLGATDQEYDDALGATDLALKQFPMVSDGVNRYLLVPVKAYGNKRARFQDAEQPAVGRDNVFMHFG